MPDSTPVSRTAARAAKIAKAQSTISGAGKAFAAAWAKIDRAQEKADRAQSGADRVKAEALAGLRPVVDQLGSLGMRDEAIAQLVGADVEEIAAIRKGPAKQQAAAPTPPNSPPAPVPPAGRAGGPVEG
jgi:hypothetical protein